MTVRPSFAYSETPMKRAHRQLTLDSIPFVDRNRLELPVQRLPKSDPQDYSLMVVGSRFIDDAEWVHATLDAFVAGNRRGRLPTHLLHGGALGVDTYASVWARTKNVADHCVGVRGGYLEKWPPKVHHWLAYKKRDLDVVDLADEVLVLWSDKCIGTEHVKDYAETHGKLSVTPILWDEEESRQRRRRKVALSV